MIFPRLVILVILLSSPIAALAEDYEFRIAYNPSSKEMKERWLERFAGTYVFINEIDYILAKKAYDNAINVFSNFDRELIRDNVGTEEERYQRFLVRLQFCRDASSKLSEALARGYKR